MNFLSTGVKEMTRRLRRQKNRLALANARKTLDRADTALGRHAWRELVGDEAVHDALAELQRLDAEVEAAHLRIAEIETEVRGHEAARETARRDHAQTLANLEEERTPFEEELAALHTVQAEHSEVLHDHNARKAALHAGQAALLKQEKRARRQGILLGEAERAERQRQFDLQRAALDEQARQLETELVAAAGPVATVAETVKKVRATLAALDERAARARADLAARERATTVAIASLHKEIASIRRQAAHTEESKEDSYLAIGRRLAVREAPPSTRSADELFAIAHRHRENYEQLAGLDAAWLQESREADRQDLRIFYFVGVSLAIVATIVLLLIFRSPSKRDWLPANTVAVLSVDVRGFTDADFTRALQAREPEAWQNVWAGLVRSVAEVPEIDVRRQVARITRALAPADEHGPAVDCLLVQMRSGVDVDYLVRRRLWHAGGFEQRDFDGLPIYEKPGIAVAQIGPDTLAMGSRESVEALIRVRLGLREDLKSDAQFFSEFHRLDDGSAFRLVTYRPRELLNLTDPILNAELLGNCDALGLTLDMREPVSAVFILNAPNGSAAGEIAHQLQANPDQVLNLHSDVPSLFIETPTVTRPHDGQQVEWRFRMTNPAAKIFLQRVSRLNMTAPAAAATVAERGQ